MFLSSLRPLTDARQCLLRLLTRTRTAPVPPHMQKQGLWKNHQRLGSPMFHHFTEPVENAIKAAAGFSFLCSIRNDLSDSSLTPFLCLSLSSCFLSLAPPLPVPPCLALAPIERFTRGELWAWGIVCLLLDINTSTPSLSSRRFLAWTRFFPNASYDLGYARKKQKLCLRVK